MQDVKLQDIKLQDMKLQDIKMTDQLATGSVQTYILYAFSNFKTLKIVLQRIIKSVDFLKLKTFQICGRTVLCCAVRSGCKLVLTDFVFLLPELHYFHLLWICCQLTIQCIAKL